MLYKQDHVMKVRQFLLRVRIVVSAGSAILNYGTSDPYAPYSGISMRIYLP